MQLKHGDIWRAIDRLAERHGLSPSGLARKAGLSPTVFNISKRATADRKRWPSTESISDILRATNTNLEEFVALAAPNGEAVRATLPLIATDAARKESMFDEEGRPSGKGWEEIRFPVLADPRAFMLEIAGKHWEPVYREGDRLVISPGEKPRRGDRVALRTRKSEIVIGRLGRESARSLEIAALDPARRLEVLAPQDIDWIGRVVWASQ